MGKSQNTDKTAFEAPDYESLTTIEECDEHLVKHKDYLVGKDITESQIKNDKKDYNGAINEQLKELKEEREHEMGVIGALNDRKRALNAGAKVTQLHPKAAARS
jgi:hypothetical protein